MKAATRRRGAPTIAACAACACLLAAACSPATRYRVLSAVFDGVPPPPGMEPAPSAAAAQAGSSAFREGLERLKVAHKPRPEPIKYLSVHKPVADRRCAECHDMERPEAGLKTDATLCDKCHIDQRRAEGWDHGPINLGSCIPCHVAHKSQYEHLLAIPLPQLCLNCHEAVSPQAPEYHAVPNFGDCTACHDPHRMY